MSHITYTQTVNNNVIFFSAFIFIKVPDLVKTLGGLYAMMESRVSTYGKLCKLQGRLDLMLSQVWFQPFKPQYLHTNSPN